jgi:hypothetical protein
MKSLASLMILSCTLCVAQRPSAPRPTVLITSGVENDSVASMDGAATRVGGVLVGTAGASTSSYEHSEVWEVFRRFAAECPAAIFVTNPETPHTLTVHTDYQKVPTMIGPIVLYQLSLLDSAGNPLYVTKKDYLRREIKPICKGIER